LSIAGTVVPGGKHKVTNNKVTRDADKGMKKTEKGVRHGTYDATHNKATKKMKVNRGNREYSNQKDL
jgi:hypothetical protein